VVNETAFVVPGDLSHNVAHDSFLRDFQTNQSNIISGDMSLLSKIGGAYDSKSHMLMAKHYGAALKSECA